jgi:3-hydroxy-3-methylglutaryl CoA synthase
MNHIVTIDGVHYIPGHRAVGAAYVGHVLRALAAQFDTVDTDTTGLRILVSDGLPDGEGETFEEFRTRLLDYLIRARAET